MSGIIIYAEHASMSEFLKGFSVLLRENKIFDFEFAGGWGDFSTSTNIRKRVWDFANHKYEKVIASADADSMNPEDHKNKLINFWNDPPNTHYNIIPWELETWFFSIPELAAQAIENSEFENFLKKHSKYPLEFQRPKKCFEYEFGYKSAEHLPKLLHLLEQQKANNYPTYESSLKALRSQESFVIFEENIHNC